ncbi:hypothetical protein V8E54_001237 [Elaphomyces granulatus]
MQETFSDRNLWLQLADLGNLGSDGYSFQHPGSRLNSVLITQFFESRTARIQLKDTCARPHSISSIIEPPAPLPFHNNCSMEKKSQLVLLSPIIAAAIGLWKRKKEKGHNVKIFAASMQDIEKALRPKSRAFIPNRYNLGQEFARALNDPLNLGRFELTRSNQLAVIAAGPRRCEDEEIVNVATRTNGILQHQKTGNIQAIVEAKRKDRIFETNKVRMQEPAEMVAWIMNSRRGLHFNPTGRFLLIAQDHAKVFLVFASFNPAYINYLKSRGGEYGPWKIDRADDMEHLAKIILAFGLRAKNDGLKINS